MIKEVSPHVYTRTLQSGGHKQGLGNEFPSVVLTLQLSTYGWQHASAVTGLVLANKRKRIGPIFNAAVSRK
jgi:hypothetical protein